jgi:hypothetical protein
VKGGPPSQTAPARSNLLKLLGSDPFLEGLLADRKQRGTAPLSFCAHDIHAPLGVFAGATATRDGLEDLDLFAVLFDQAADVDDALEADVGMFLTFGGWVRGVRCRLTLAAHGARPPE